MNELEQRLRQTNTDLSEAKAQRSALLAQYELLEAECRAVGVVSGRAGFRLAELLGEVRRLDGRIRYLEGRQAITEYELCARKQSLASARRVLAELPRSASSRRELAVIEELRRRAQRIIGDVLG